MHTPLTSVEICAGAGGQALGLEMAGFKHLAAVEIDDWAVKTLQGAVAKLGGEPRRPSFSFPDGRCVPAFSGRLEDPVDDHRVRIGVPISKHRALTFP